MLRDLETLNALRFWLVGSIAERGGDIAREMWPFILVGTVLALACGRLLNGLALGEDVARSLGQRIVRTRVLVGVCIVLLAGTATAAAGPIVFVGLVVPHVARAITGPDYRWILAFSRGAGPDDAARRRHRRARDRPAARARGERRDGARRRAAVHRARAAPQAGGALTPMAVADTTALPARSALETVARAHAASRARPRRVCLVLAAATFVVFCVSVSVGDYPIALTDVVPAMLGLGDQATVVVAQDLRLPRAINGLLVGIVLGMSGAIFQAVARNPLASPDILGVLYGSAVVAVFVITTWARPSRCCTPARSPARWGWACSSTCSPTATACRRTASCSSA